MELIDFSALNEALSLLFSEPKYWLVVFPGIILGLVFGATPGLQISMAMAIFMPMTLNMDFLQAMLFLSAIFTGGSFGGGIPAILMNIPGTSSAIATAFDGYPMSKKGLHNEALGYSLGASAFGAFIGTMILFILIQPISKLVLKIGPAEMAFVVLWGITLIASLKGDFVLKGLIAGFVGLLIGTIGYNEEGVLRGAMDIEYLLDGVPIIPAMMGMFAASELFRLANTKYLVKDEGRRKVRVSLIIKGMVSAFKYPFILARGCLIGIFIGAVPGVGSSVSNLISYIETKRRDKDPKSFGNGNPKGVVASESANSSSEAGSLATLLALGIPGGGATAVMLAAFAMHNITGGPQFIREQTDIVYAIILSNIGQALLVVLLGIITLPLLASVVKIKLTYLIPSVLVLASMGSFGLTGNIAGPVTVLVFSCVGYIFRRYDYSVPACVIGMILGKMAEGSLLNTYQISGGELSYIFERPIALVIFVLMIVSLFGSKFISMLRSKK